MISSGASATQRIECVLYNIKKQIAQLTGCTKKFAVYLVIVCEA